MHAVTLISLIVVVVLTNLQQTQLQSTETAGGKLSLSMESLSNLKTHINNLSIAEVCYHLTECFISEKNPSTSEIKFYVHNGYCMTKSKSATFVVADYCPYIPKRSIQSTKVSHITYYQMGLQLTPSLISPAAGTTERAICVESVKPAMVLQSMHSV